LGARVDSDEYEKESAQDFVLWKAKKEGEPYWQSPFGEGRPGWHLECSAMSMKYLGETFDIHTGGVDNIFPHHENEIAQSEGYSGKRFVNYWLHSSHLLVDSEKMAKSKGNFYTLKDLLGRGIQGRTLRYLLASAHYRKNLNFTFDGLSHAKQELEKIDDFMYRLNHEKVSQGENADLGEKIENAKKEFVQAMDDDLNISGGIGALFKFMKEANAACDKGSVTGKNRDEIISLMHSLDSVLVFLPKEAELLDEEIEKMIVMRTEAREKKDYQTADRIRKELLEKGILLDDTPYGVRWKRK